MILKMEKLSVFGLLSDREKLLDSLMRERCIQMQPAEEMDNYEEIEPLTQSGEVHSYELEQKLSRFGAALSAINFYAAKKGLFARKPRVLYEDLEDAALMRQAEEQCAAIERITGEISELRAAKNRDLFQAASLTPWADLDLDLELTGTRSTSVLYITLPAKSDIAELEHSCGELSAVLQTVGEDRELKYLLAVVHRADEDGLWNLLKTYGATRMSFASLTGTVGENLARLDRQVAETDRQIAAREDELRAIGQDIFALQYGVDATAVRVQRERAGHRLRSTGKTFCFTAWVPEAKRKDTMDILERFGCYYELREPAGEEEPPILLKNPSLATPYEAVTEMYSLPAYRGFDPNIFVAFFYFLFFGMMLSDAGYGLVLFFGGMWLNRKMDLGANARKIVKVISWGGLSAVIWGALYGSWFGDLIEVIPREFFGYTVTIPRLLDPLTQAVIVMVMCLALGFVHLLFGLGIKAYMLVKRGKVWDAIFDVGFWYLLLLGLVGMLVVMVTMGTDGALFTVCVVLAVVGAAGLVLTQGRDKKNPILRLGSGIISLYDVTGYLSDVLSYSRILALGLATGVIAQVVNIMGTLAGGGIVGAIVMIVVFVFGSALNLAINTLGAYVHTARLQYVEFFGKFYEAGGKPFRPFAAQTKYLVVTNKEES